MSSYGEAVFTSTPAGTVVCDRADPRILISAKLLGEIERHWGADWVTLDEDDILTFNATNRRVVYRVHRDQYLFEQDAYPAEWPD